MMQHRSPRLHRLVFALACLCLALGQAFAPAPGSDALGANAPGTNTTGISVANPGTPAPAPALTKPWPMPGGLKAARIPLEGTIDRFTYAMLERKTQQAIDAGCQLIVLDINSPGGHVTWALECARYLRGLPSKGVRTVAWVNTMAYSGGILVAAACEQRVVAPGAQAGDCAPISMFGNLNPTERGKILSPILADFKASTGQSMQAAYLAMCLLDIEVYLVENPTTGQRALVNQIDKAMMVDGMSAQEAEESRGWTDAQSQATGGVGAPTNQLALAKDLGQWQLVQTLPSGRALPGGRVHDGKSLFTLSGQDMVDYGMAHSEVGTPAQLEQLVQSPNMAFLKRTWAEPVAEFLTHPAIRALLVVAMLVGGYIEMVSPGLVLPGLIAGVSLLALVIAPFFLGLAAVWHILLFGVGVVLLLVELFFTPTFGILGILGLGAMVLALVAAVMPGPGLVGNQWTSALFWQTTAWLAAGLLVGCIGIGVVTQKMGSLPLLSGLILNSPEPRPIDPSLDDAAMPELHVGDTGQTLTVLRPSGQAQIGDHVVDVVADGAYIEAGQTVAIQSIEGNHIVVQPPEAPETTP